MTKHEAEELVARINDSGEARAILEKVGAA